ncbi:hypothetical protein ACRBF7_000723 [Providencia stuartii]|uniref:hypothetical protein n=1 Tax=Providencia stuartii TaxID=588 RepID=UPI000C9C00C7|nr:hypothetical protein [Providencia stuartii]HEM8216762.1 hypothetical protein [Providencia stuartii]
MSKDKVYNKNHRRKFLFKKGNALSKKRKNALGGNLQKRLRDNKIVREYISLINTRISSIERLHKYSSEFYYANQTCITLMNKYSINKSYVLFDDLETHVDSELELKKHTILPFFLTQENITAKLACKYNLSKDSIFSIIKKAQKLRNSSTQWSPRIIPLPQKRISIYHNDGVTKMTNEEYLNQKIKSYDSEERVAIHNIKAAEYSNEEDRAIDIETTKKYYNEQRENLNQLKRRTKDSPLSQAYEQNILRNTYLSVILTSDSYQKYEFDRLKWDKNNLKEL